MVINSKGRIHNVFLILYPSVKNLYGAVIQLVGIAPRIRMSDLVELKQIRNGHIIHVIKLLGKTAEILREKMAVKSSLENKQQVLERKSI